MLIFASNSMLNLKRPATKLRCELYYTIFKLSYLTTAYTMFFFNVYEMRMSKHIYRLFFFFVNLNYKFLCFHTIVLICCKTINYLIIQYLYVNFSATIKNVRAQFSRAFIASCCNDSRRVQFTEKKR